MADKSLLAYGGDTGRVYIGVYPNLDKRYSQLSISGDLWAAAFSPDGEYLALGHSYNPGLTLINAKTWKTIAGLPSISGGVEALCFSPDSSMLAVGHQSGNELTVIDMATLTVISAVPSPAQDVVDLDFSPDGQYLAAAHDYGYKVLRTSDWSEISTEVSFSYDGTGVSFSPDGAFLAISDNDSPGISVVSTADWQIVSGSPSPGSRRRGIQFSNGGTMMAALEDGSATVYEVPSWTVLATLSADLSGIGFAAAFSPDDSILALGYQNSPYLTLYDTQTWATISSELSESNDVKAIAFSPTTTLPQRQIKTLDYQGNQVSATVKVLDRSNGSIEQVIESSGQTTIESLAFGDFWLVMPDDRTGATEDAFSRITLDATSGDLPPLVLAQGYIGDLVTISSNLTTQAGAPGDEVVIRNWTTRELVAKVIPDANGDWSAEVPPGTYDVSYIAENCAPVIHGPYTVELP